MLSFFQRDVLDENLDLIEPVSVGFPTYSGILHHCKFSPDCVLHYVEDANTVGADLSAAEQFFEKQYRMYTS